MENVWSGRKEVLLKAVTRWSLRCCCGLDELLLQVEKFQNRKWCHVREQEAAAQTENGFRVKMKLFVCWLDWVDG